MALKHLSFRILFLAVFLPPVLYIFTIQGLELYLENTWRSELKDRLLSEPGELLEGRRSLQEAVRSNIQAYLQSRWLIGLGPEVRILVRTRSGRDIYPNPDSPDPYALQHDDDLTSLPRASAAQHLAKANLEIMQEGLVFSLSVDIPRNTWLSNAVLIGYIFIFTALLSLMYRSNVRQAEAVTRQQELDLQATREKLQQAQSRLQEALDKEQTYRLQIEQQQQDLSRADRQLKMTEKEALEEMEALEEKLQTSSLKRQEREEELEKLLQEVEELQSRQDPPSRKREKQSAALEKRLKVLYKNTAFHDRALEGFRRLPEDMQLKAEEIVHTLDRDPGLVKVKRKVFPKRGEVSALETIFSYKGRIYWRKNDSGLVEILAVGTKNTQARDLSYLESLPS